MRNRKSNPEGVSPRDLTYCSHKPECIVTTNPDRSVLITIITWHFQFRPVNVSILHSTHAFQIGVFKFVFTISTTIKHIYKGSANIIEGCNVACDTNDCWNFQFLPPSWRHAHAHFGFAHRQQPLRWLEPFLKHWYVKIYELIAPHTLKWINSVIKLGHFVWNIIYCLRRIKFKDRWVVFFIYDSLCWTKSPTAASLGSRNDAMWTICICICICEVVDKSQLGYHVHGGGGGGGGGGWVRSLMAWRV